MAITAISTASCVKGRAGISKLWVTECENVTGLTFSTDQEVTAITMATSATFKLIGFQKNTAFFNQTKTRVGNSHNVEQNIQFVLPVMSQAFRLGLYNLNLPCCIVAIVKTNAGNYFFAGITWTSGTDTFDFEDLQAGDGSGNTGADPKADSNQFIENLVCDSGFYAPVSTVAEGDIAV